MKTIGQPRFGLADHNIKMQYNICCQQCIVIKWDTFLVRLYKPASHITSEMK